MTWLDRLSGLSPKLRGGITLAGLIGGTGCIAIGNVISSSPMQIVGYAAVCGAWLFYRLMEFCETRTRAKVRRRPDNQQAVADTRPVALAIDREINGGSMVWIKPEQHRVHLTHRILNILQADPAFLSVL